MVDVEATTVINRPVEAVFAFVADFQNHPRWESNFVEVRRVSPGPIGFGTIYQCRLRVPGQRVTSRIEITEFTPNQLICAGRCGDADIKPAPAPATTNHWRTNREGHDPWLEH